MRLFGKLLAVMMLSGVMTACIEPKTSTMEWQVQSSEKVSQKGDILSTPAAMTDGWIAAQVPSTLMGVLTANGIEPEALTAEAAHIAPGRQLPLLCDQFHAILFLSSSISRPLPPVRQAQEQPGQPARQTKHINFHRNLPF